MNKAARIQELKGRVKRCCCKYCGHPLEIKQIIFSEHTDARIELFCTSCDRIEYGVEKEIYLSAKFFVEQLKFNHYPDLDDNNRRQQMNIAKVCEIMAWGHSNLGILNHDGFQVPITMNADIIGNSITISEDTLNALCEEAEL